MAIKNVTEDVDESTTSTITDASNMELERIDSEAGAEVNEAVIPTENDVLLGRGGKGFKHEGNKKLRIIANNSIHKYNYAKKHEKLIIAKTIFNQVKAMDPPGRFLKRKLGNPRIICWAEVSEETGIEKVSQVLRDLRRNYLPAMDSSCSSTMSEMTNRDETMMMNANMQQFTQVAQPQYLPEQRQQLLPSFNNFCTFSIPPPPSSHQPLASPTYPNHDSWSPPSSCNCTHPRFAPLKNMNCHFNGTVSYSLQCDRCHRQYKGQLMYVNGAVADSQTKMVTGQQELQQQQQQHTNYYHHVPSTQMVTPQVHQGHFSTQQPNPFPPSW